MKTRRLTWFVAAMAVLLCACGGDDEPGQTLLPFNMERQAEVIEGYQQKQQVYTGNGEYSLVMADESVARATWQPAFGGLDYGSIVIEGLKRGQTQLNVTDVKAAKTIGIDVRVVSPNFYMLDPVTSGHKALQGLVVSCFIPQGDTDRKVLFFKKEGQGLHYLTSGNYHTEDGGDRGLVLVMNYPMVEKDSTLSTVEGAPLTSHRFYFEKATTAATDILSATSELPENQRKGTTLVMTEEGTGRTVSGNLVYGPDYNKIIPFGLLP